MDDIKKIPTLKKLPSATTSMFFFICLTIIYGFMMIYSINSSNDVSSIVSNSNNQIYSLVYIIFLVLGSYFINVNISKKICNDIIQWGTISTITFLPWIIIFGTLYFILELFPGWVRPFSNTIGYLIVNSLGATEKVKEILIKKGDLGENKQDKNSIIEAINNIEKNYSRFINEIDTDPVSFKNFIGNLIEGQAIESGITIENFWEDDKIKELFKLINIKHVVGKLFWYMLAGSLIASVSYSFIVDLECGKTLAQSSKDYEELYSKIKKPIKGTKWNRLLEQPSDYDNQNYTRKLSYLVSNYGHKFTQTDSNGQLISVINITPAELRESGVTEEIPSNSYIVINNAYYRPTE